ncbi:MAG TPA: SH3 domain-containing protein [Rhizomicrobium sp.]|nr:SH3 domain-containing protein [Rhizomicrobium sp.]
MGVRKTLRLRVAWFGIILLARSVLSAAVADEASPVPRFASLSRDQVFMREGPTYRHRILWVYHRKGLPVEILGQFDVWRRIRDRDGTTGWVHSSMISEIRTVLVTAQSPARIFRGNDPHSEILALAQPGVIAKLETCTAVLCEIDAQGTEGWIEKKNIWGVKADEVFR